MMRHNMRLSGISIIIVLTTASRTAAKWVEGHVDTKSNWAFLSRFCFLSLDGQFEYLIEFDRDMGTPNLLLYYDDDNQWPAVYHSAKTCKEREEILNKAGQNQMIKLSYWYPDTEYSGCVVTKADKELPAGKSSTVAPKTTPKTKTTNKSTLNLPELPLNSSYYDQFLKTTKPTIDKTISTITDSNFTTWYELLPTDDMNSTTTVLPDDELWETIRNYTKVWENKEKYNGTLMNKMKDVELLFDKKSTHRVKRFSELYERFRRRRLNSESDEKGFSSSSNIERLIVSCHNSRRFRSARERWWFIAISNCDSAKGLDIRYKFLMTNGPEGDFWHEHFSADEFYVLPVLLAYMFAYVIVMIAVVLCSVELKSRHLLHSTYKLFLISIVSQHFGIVIQSLAYIRYAINGVGNASARTFGQFLCGVSETTFLLLLVLLAKGYTVTRGRLKVGFTVRLTVFMCCYIVTYIVLFVYQAKAFDPGEVLYLYESPPGYGLIVLRVLAWCVFAYSTFFTVRKYPDKNTFYGPFFICSTLWFHAGPLFILTANTYIDKWVRESVVTAVLLLITFCGHIMFLLLTLPVFANKNFPYHVRTTQIGVMEVTGNPTLDSFGPNAYHPTDGAAQTVIIPLTRRTEELIGNIYNQYMAPTGNGHANGLPKRMNSMSPTSLPKTLNGIPNGLISQDSTETNNSDDIKPYIPKENKEIFTVENQFDKINQNSAQSSKNNNLNPNKFGQSNSKSEQTSLESDKSDLKSEQSSFKSEKSSFKSEQSSLNNISARNDLPNVLRSKRAILEPIKRDDVPSWSFAKGPSIIAMQKKITEDEMSSTTTGFPPIASKKLPKVPPVKNGVLASSGEISTIQEGHIQSYPGKVSQATVDLFTISKGKDGPIV